MKSLKIGLLLFLMIGYHLCVLAQEPSVDFVDKGISYHIRDFQRMEVGVVKIDNDTITHLCLPKTVKFKDKNWKVTAIENNAFNKHKQLTTADISSVHTIGNYAFNDCQSLTTVQMEAVEKIGNAAFSNSGITAIDFTNVTSIDEFAFQGCSRLTSIDLKNVTWIGAYTFNNCYGLTDVNFGKVNTISHHAFENCYRLTSIDLKEVSWLGSNVFAGCTRLASVKLHKVSTCGNSVFGGCTQLTTVDVGNSTIIGEHTFSGCTQIKEIDLKNVRTVEGSAFYGCTGLTSLDFKNVTSIGYSVCHKCTSLTTVNLRLVNSIEPYAFKECSQLSEIHLGKVTSIGNEAFKGCENLSSIDFGACTSIAYQAFEGCSRLTTIHLEKVGSIGSYAFRNCPAIKDITLTTGTPPVVPKDYYNGITDPFDALVHLDATLRIPAGSKGHYSQADFWKNFIDIVEEGPSSQLPLTVSCSTGGAVSFGHSSATGNEVTENCIKGSTIVLTFLPYAHYRLQSVTLNGKDITSEVKNNTYTFTLDEGTSIQVVFTKIPIWLTLRQADNGQTEMLAEEGKSYRFRLRADEGWHIHSVTYNGEDVTTQLRDDCFTTPALYASAVLNVTFEYNNPSAIQTQNVSSVSIHGHQGKLWVDGAKRGTDIRVYTENGALVVKTKAGHAPSIQITLPEGRVYIVNVAQRTFKLHL